MSDSERSSFGSDSDEDEHQPDEKYLIFDSYVNGRWPEKKACFDVLHCLWSDRIILDKKSRDETDEFIDVEAFDLLMNEETTLRFRKHFPGDIYAIHYLGSDFGLIVQKIGQSCSIALVKLNWIISEFVMIEHIKKENVEYLNILVDKMDRSKFALKWTQDVETYNYQIGELKKGKIEYSNEVLRSRCDYGCFSGGKLIGNNTQQDSDLHVYNLATSKEQTFKVDQTLLIGHNHLASLDSLSCECINNRLYARVILKESDHIYKGPKSSGIAWAELGTNKWSLMDFKTNLTIKKFEFFNGSLVVSANFGYGETKIYGIPTKHPNHLRYSAWLLVVKIMKQKEERDPYGAAKKFLPLNNDLREIWFKDEEKSNKMEH